MDLLFMGKIRKCFAFVLMLMLAIPTASAEFSPRWQSLVSGKAMRLEMTGSASALLPLDGETLEAMNGLLSQAQLTLQSRENEEGTLSRMTLKLSGENLMDVSVLQGKEDTVTVFGENGNGYRTGRGEKDALSLLTGRSGSVPRWDLLPREYLDAAPSFYTVLENAAPGTTVKKSTSVKNAVSSPVYVEYMLTAEEMNAVWPKLLKALEPVLNAIFETAEDWGNEWKGTLSRVRFSGECRFKRLLSQENGDMGLQFTGMGDAGQGVRKITLFGGFTQDRGGYISLALPAVKGKNTWKVTYGQKLTEKSGKNTLTISGTYINTLNGKTQSAEWEGNLTNALKNGTEALSGKITADVNLGRKESYTVKPDLVFDDTGLHGTVTIQKKQGKTQTLSAVLSVLLTGDPEERFSAGPIMDLSGMEKENVRAKIMQELQNLSSAWIRYLAALPQDTRALLTHQLRGEAWMTREESVLPPEDLPEAAQADGWIVEEE